MPALSATVITLLLILLTAGSALAGPPLVTDDAGTTDADRIEIELNGSFALDDQTQSAVTSRRSTADAELKISTGLYENLGISVAIPYTISERVRENGQLAGNNEGFGDITIELKYAFAELAGIRFALRPSVIAPAGRYSAGLSEGRWQVGTTLIATREFEDGRYALHANAGYEHHSYRADEVRDSTRSDLWSGSVAGEARVMKGLTAVLDFGLGTDPARGSNDPCVYALAGARYELNEHLDINAGVKLGLTGPEDDVTLLYGLVLKL